MADTQKVDHPVFYRVVGTVPYSDYSGKAPRQVYRSLDIQCVGRWSPVGPLDWLMHTILATIGQQYEIFPDLLKRIC